MTRLEAIAILDGFKYNPLLNEQHFEALDMAVSVLSADVRENVHGEWELCEDQDGLYGVCSKCGTDADFQHYGVPYPFCPNCGADMRKAVSE